MGVVMGVIGDIALVAILAAFVDMFLPGAKNHYGIKLVFGLYFLAILLNPVVVFFTEADFGSLDFRELSVSEYEDTDNLEDAEVLNEAAVSLSQEVETRLGAVYEGMDFTVAVHLTSQEVEGVEVNVHGAEPGRERVIEDDIKTILAKDYGVERKKVKVVFT